jgi:methylglyoxal synthase
MKEHMRRFEKEKKIALIAHDNKKKDLIEWATYNKKALAKHKLVATGTTGKLIEEALDRKITKVLSGPLGGDQQIGAMIASGDIDMVFFFFDPMEAQPHDSDVKALLRLVVTWNLPMACDRTTADFLITSKFMQEVYEYILPDYTHYLSRNIEKP